MRCGRRRVRARRSLSRRARRREARSINLREAMAAVSERSSNGVDSNGLHCPSRRPLGASSELTLPEAASDCLDGIQATRYRSRVPARPSRTTMKRAAIVSPIRTGVGKYLGALSRHDGRRAGRGGAQGAGRAHQDRSRQDRRRDLRPGLRARARRPASRAGRRWRRACRSRCPATSSTAAAARACRR